MRSAVLMGFQHVRDPAARGLDTSTISQYVNNVISLSNKERLPFARGAVWVEKMVIHVNAVAQNT